MDRTEGPDRPERPDQRPGLERRLDGEGLPTPAGREPEAGDDERNVSDTLSGFGVNAALVEEIRQRYEVDPNSVHASWA